MPGTGPERLDIDFTTVNDVSPDDVERAREVVARVLAHSPRPVLYAKVTLNVLPDPAVARPNLVSVRVDLNGWPVNAFAAGTTMAGAIGLAGARLRARVHHMAGYWEARRRMRQRTPSVITTTVPSTTGPTTTVSAVGHGETKELHDA